MDQSPSFRSPLGCCPSIGLYSSTASLTANHSDGPLDDGPFGRHSPRLRFRMHDSTARIHPPPLTVQTPQCRTQTQKAIPIPTVVLCPPDPAVAPTQNSSTTETLATILHPISQPPRPPSEVEGHNQDPLQTRWMIHPTPPPWEWDTTIAPSLSIFSSPTGPAVAPTLLDSIAYADPPYHALIDTGALITGPRGAGGSTFRTPRRWFLIPHFPKSFPPNFSHNRTINHIP